MTRPARHLIPAEAVDAERVLSFINTLSARPTGQPVERLVSYEALALWAQEEKLLAAAAAERLRGHATRRPQHAAVALTRAKAFREALNDLLAALDARQTPPSGVLEALSATLARAYSNARLVPHEEALQWVASTDDDLERVLWEVGRSAGRLLVSPRLARVRPCAADDCGWWFLDDTKNRSRRWCDMKLCGNRSKVRRFRGKSA